MIYIVDTSSFSVFRNYYPSAFPSFWEGVNALVEDGTIRSVREVFNELQNDNRVAFIQEWAKDHREIFLTPTQAEIDAVTGILAIIHFQAVIDAKALLKGTPVADPFIVASARVNDAVVITEESMRPNAAKIPNICEHFDVACHNLEWLIAQQRWQF